MVRNFCIFLHIIERSDPGKTVTLWNDGRQMFLAISDYSGHGWLGTVRRLKKVRNGP
jgi:hypothetical protein